MMTRHDSCFGILVLAGAALIPRYDWVALTPSGRRDQGQPLDRRQGASVVDAPALTRQTC